MCDRIAIINKGNLVAFDTTNKNYLKELRLKKLHLNLKEFDSNISLNLTKCKIFNTLK